MAEKALQTKEIVELQPMSPHDRRIVHMAISEIPGLSTRSEGEGEDRHILVVPTAAPWLLKDWLSYDGYVLVDVPAISLNPTQQNLLASAEYQDALARVDVWRARLVVAVARGDLAPFIDRVRTAGAP